MQCYSKGIWKPLITLLNLIPGVLIGIIALLAAMFWISLYLLGTDNPYFTGTPFGIAGACAIFGGMGYAVGFSDRGTSSIRSGMLATGTLYFVAALALTFTGMLVPTVQLGSDGSPSQEFMKGYLDYVLAGSAFAAMIAFAAATTIWGCIFPGLVRWHFEKS